MNDLNRQSPLSKEETACLGRIFSLVEQFHALLKTAEAQSHEFQLAVQRQQKAVAEFAELQALVSSL